MDFKKKLSQRININDIYEILYLIQNNNIQKDKLYELIFDSDDFTAYQTLWVFTHCSFSENEWLYQKKDELINQVLVCEHPGKRRLFLQLLFRQPVPNPLRVDFLDFCLERMISKKELPGVQSLCMKLAYEQCRTSPELIQEFCSILSIMDFDLLPASMKAVRKNVLKAMKTGKSLS